MELVANVWPVVDITTGFVQRYFIRAYAIDAEDKIISAVLNGLASSDFRISKVFKIPPQFEMMSEHSTISGIVSIDMFQQEIPIILEEGYKSLEKDYLRIQGVDISSGTPQVVNVVPRFPENPYILITVLIETIDGQLIPQLGQ
ncbi:hypothetical protein [Photobacterium aquimaris]|uniref:Uncharacterized protein n=1 Tax=Photobacterium aquimaris TaxID=512643 RepID=A0A2T3HU39_9GAMM|nr:hypothetical protein [Photobacterium aquimaris]OBU24355.1 hypothetical protein AYY21_02265 [Photobacterium aquimaris]PQJ40457.1 hypothetical protein BTN98_01920 [Photobacterium aquimaris]PST99329.1 hypothetical protein C0W81_17195 [Photobacterium aquimaris]